MTEVMLLAVKSSMLAVCIVGEQNYILDTVSASIIRDRYGAALCVLTLWQQVENEEHSQVICCINVHVYIISICGWLCIYWWWREIQFL